jgi:serine/threonine-protein kinase HipA
MNSRICLHCYKELIPGETLYHKRCVKNIFHLSEPPDLPYGMEELGKLAESIIQSRVTIPGVQAKISMHISSERGHSRFTIVGLWGRYILKPPVGIYPYLPENESLTMKMAEAVKIKTVPNALIPLKTGELCYITERIDRTESGIKIQMEDMCQLTGRLTEHKYQGSYEQVASAIKKYSDNPVFDITELLKILLFSFITGNGDMHLKNFSLIETDDLIALAPAYDLLSTRLVISEKDDPDETALTLNGKKRKLKSEDFRIFSEKAGLTAKQFSNIFDQIIEAEPLFIGLIEKSFLPGHLKEDYLSIISGRYSRLGDNKKL